MKKEIKGERSKDLDKRLKGNHACRNKEMELLTKSFVKTDFNRDHIGHLIGWSVQRS